MEENSHDELSPLTERGHYWLAHLKSSQTRSTPLAQYAAENELKLSSLYFWQGKLRKSGHLRVSDSKSPTNNHFQRIRVLPSIQAPIQVRLPNGLAIEWSGAGGKSLLRDAIKAALSSS